MKFKKEWRMIMMENLIGNLINYQDKAVVRLAMEGVLLKEMENLEISNVDLSKNELHLQNELEHRTIKVSQVAIGDIIKAEREVIYYIENGSEEGYRVLVESEKILKTTDVNKSVIEEIKDRTRMIQRQFDISIPTK